MALILGTEYCKVDSNGRFKFPIALKRQLETEDCRFVIRRGFTSEYLELWTMDSNDRLLIPPEQKSVIGDAKEIVLQSTGKCIEIWERSAYDKMNDSITDFASIVDKRLGELYGLSSAGDAE